MKKSLNNILLGITALKLLFAGCSLEKELHKNYYTFAIIPDSQYYVNETHDGKKGMFQSQVNWINGNVNSENIKLVAHLGDIVNTGGEAEEINSAHEIMSSLRGIQSIWAIGNHDQDPRGNSTGISPYNANFLFHREPNRGLYSDVDNNYLLFECGEEKFIALTLEYNFSSDALEWADDIIEEYSDRKAMVISHGLFADDGKSFSDSGDQMYETFKDNENVFLMLGGHINGEHCRKDTYQGHVINSMLVDYQGNGHGGNGFMRLLKYYPEENKMEAKTYSPYLNRYETDSDSNYIIDLD